jgi:two-component system, cell cycle response regulator DivK
VLRILVVEDHVDTRELLTSYFESQGLRVDVAATGLQGLERAVASPPDAIVLDLELPEMDGWATAHRLKAHPSTRHVPILAVSAHAFPEDQARAYESGCDAFIAKPSLPPDVLRAIRRLLVP